MGYTPVEGWGKLPDGWSFVEATAVAVDSDDHVWVFNRGAHPVIVFDKQGVFKRSWGEGLIRRAHGITIGPDGTIWLTDDLHHTVRQFTPEGKLLVTLGDPDTPSMAHCGKAFNRPTHVAISPRTGDIYVSDGYGNSRVHKYDPSGRLLKSWGEPGPTRGASTFRTTSRRTPAGAYMSPIVRTRVCRSSTRTAPTSVSSITSIVRADSRRRRGWAISSSSASCPRTSP